MAFTRTVTVDVKAAVEVLSGVSVAVGADGGMEVVVSVCTGVGLTVGVSDGVFVAEGVGARGSAMDLMRPPRTWTDVSKAGQIATASACSPAAIAWPFASHRD